MDKEHQTLTSAEFIHQFFAQMQAIDKTFDIYAKKLGLNYISLLVLEYIYENPEHCTQKKIVEATFSPKQTVNLIVKSFWQQGYLELKETPADRRNKEIFLTAAGKTYAEKILRPVYKAEEDAVGHMTEEERKTMLQCTSLYAEKCREWLL